MVLGRFPGNGKFFHLRNSLLFRDCNKSKVDSMEEWFPGVMTFSGPK